MSEQTSETRYIGTVTDRMTGETIYRSRPTTTWGEAQTLAERHARGERYAVQADVADDIHAAAIALGRLGGISRSPAKRAAAAANARARWTGRAPSWFRGECGAGWGAVVRDADEARVVTAERYHEPPERIRVWAYASRADAYDGRRGVVL